MKVLIRRHIAKSMSYRILGTITTVIIGYVLSGNKHWSEIRKGKNMGITNPDATRYIVEDPDGEIIKIETKKAVMELLGCSGFFFSCKKYKKYKLIGKEKINKKE